MPSCSHRRHSRSKADRAVLRACNRRQRRQRGRSSRGPGGLRCSRGLRNSRGWRCSRGWSGRGRRALRCSRSRRGRRRRGSDVCRQARLLRPVLAHEVVAGSFTALTQRGQHLVRRLTAVQRRDERLDDRHGAIVGPDVAPGFQEVRLGYVPLAHLRGLVFIQADMRADRHLGERGGELQIGRRGVDRIAAQNQQGVHGTGVHVRDERTQIRELVRRARFDGLGIRDRLAHVAQRGVHGVRQGMHRRRRAVARDHDAAALGRLQVGDERRHERRGRFGQRGGGGASHTHLRGHRARERIELGRSEWKPMIGARAADGRRAFNGVEPVARLPAFRATPRGERARMTQARGARGHEVGVERQDDVGLVERVLRVHVFAERLAAALAGVVTPDRLPLHPPRFGQARQDLFELGGERRRRHGLGQDAETRALLGLLRRGARIAARKRTR